jgi:hypothetical protein
MGIISIKTCTECGDVLSTANDKPICIDCQVDAVYKYHNIRQAIDIKYIEIAGDYYFYNHNYQQALDYYDKSIKR